MQRTRLVDNVVKATFTGSGTSDKLLGSQVLTRAAARSRSRCRSTASLNFAMVGSEDGTDNDYNDGIAVLNWPLG
ncbi:hypothetical protein PEE19_02455 [Ralstonia solanacearum]